MSCPACDGVPEGDRRRLLEPLCERHLSEVPALSEEVLRAAFEAGQRARQACLDAYVPPMLPSGLRFR
jgi:hypothetical protein